MNTSIIKKTHSVTIYYFIEEMKQNCRLALRFREHFQYLLISIYNLTHV